MYHGLLRGTRHGPVRGIFRTHPLAGASEIIVDTQKEPLTAAQLNTMLGFGSAAIWKNLWLLNESASPMNPHLGASQLTTAAGTPTYGADGPLDIFDKGVSFTDGQVASVASPNAAVTFGANHWAVLVEAKFTGLPGGNRFLVGHDGAEDCFIQYMQTTGQVRGVVVGGTIGTQLATIAVNHNTASSHTFLFVGVNGGNMVFASELGTSGNVSIATEAALDFVSTWRIGGSNACPGTVSLMAVAISDGSTAQNNAITSLQSNIQTAITNFRTATGR